MTTFTAPLIVADEVTDAGGAREVILAEPTPGVALDIQSTEGGVKVPSLTQEEIDDLPIVNGNIFYNITTETLQSVQNDVTGNLSNGADPSGPYVIYKPDPTLPNAQDISQIMTAPNDGILKIFITDEGGGQILAAEAGVDYYSPNFPTILRDDQTLGNQSFGVTAGNDTMTGDNNIFIGKNCGEGITSGDKTIGIGTFALQNGTLVSSTGTIAIGFAAMQNYPGGGDGNVAIGFASLSSLNGADEKNTAVGGATGAAISAGFRNCLFGYAAVGSASLCHNTVAMGYFAGQNKNNYESCVFIGTAADATADNLTNSIAIGAGALVSASNSCVIGNGTVKVGIGTSTPGAFLEVDSGSDIGVMTTSVTNALKVNGGICTSVTSTNSSNYGALDGDYVILATDSASQNIVLPTVAGDNRGKVVIIKDANGNAATRSLTVTTTDGAKVDKASAASPIPITTTNFGGAILTNDGTDWWVIGNVN